MTGKGMHYRLVARCSTCVAALAVGFTSVAQAQEVQSESDRDDIVVTGTRLSNPNLASSSPVSTITGEAIALSSNLTSIDKLLNDLPQFSATQGSTTPVAGDSQLVSLADLRGLGAQRTLVLVNGARYIAANTANQVDLNTIPMGLVRRVDVVTGGASAVYGSDAIAGVVNFILNENFTGLEARGSTKITEKGDGFTYNLGLTVGTELAGGRGNVALDLGFTDRRRVIAADRDWATLQLQSATCEPQSISGNLYIGVPSTAPGAVPCYTVSGSGTLPQGTINNNIVFDNNGNAITPRPPGLLENFYPDNYLQLPLRRWTANALAHYEVFDDVEIYARFAYTHLSISQNQRSTSTNTTQFPPVEINYINNPFVTPMT